MKTVGDKDLPIMSGSGDRNQISTKDNPLIGGFPTGQPLTEWRPKRMPNRKQLHKKPAPSDRKLKPICKYCGDFCDSDFYGKHGPGKDECYGKSTPKGYEPRV